MSNTVGSFARFLVVGVLLLGVGRDARAESIPARPFVMRDTIQLSAELQSHVEAMLQGSPTFRRQFDRILDAHKLVICARIDPTFTDRSFRARSTIRRYDSGLLVVSMDIGPGPGKPEWIAHEFEHVLEQLDGLNLPTLAYRRHAGTWYSGPDMIETTRATRAGRTVIGEMHGRRGRPDKFVE